MAARVSSKNSFEEEQPEPCFQSVPRLRSDTPSDTSSKSTGVPKKVHFSHTEWSDSNSTAIDSLVTVEEATWDQEDLDALFMPHEIDAWGDHVKLGLVRQLGRAPRNHAHVDLMMSFQDGHFAAVKRIPNSWMRSSPKEFDECHPAAQERPWLDLGIQRYLNQQNFRYACRLEAIFTDPLQTYVVTSYADQGDLFEWVADPRSLGLEREARMRPIAGQLWEAVQWLHNHAIAHRDLCLENIVLISSEDRPLVKVVDFGMASVGSRWSRGCYGAKGYQAPEMHEPMEYDSFLTDSFAVGVILFAMATRDQLWLSSRPGVCEHFGYMAQYGLRKFCDRRHVGQTGKMVSEVLSGELLDLLEPLLALDTSSRATFGERGFDLSRFTVWDATWLSASPEPHEERV